MTVRLQALGFSVRQFQFQYDDQVENLKYDEKGLPV